MTSTPDRSHRRLTLSANDKKFAGVCGGLAEYFNTDPTLVRLIFAVLLVLGGSGVVVYLVAWVVLPSAASSGALPTASADHVLEQLERLGELKAAGVLTEAEFHTQKAKILSG